MELQKNLYLVFVGFFVTFFLIISGVVWYSLSVLNEYREEYDVMVAERENYSTNMEAMRNKNRILRQITGMKFSNADSTADAVEFYSFVSQAIEESGLNMLSMQTGEGNADENTTTTKILTMKLRGNYYSLVKLFAAWRNMPLASRITSLKIARDQSAPGFFVDADVTLEAYTAEGD